MFRRFALVKIALITALAGAAFAQAPVVAAGGVLNAASLVKGQPVALGSFVAIFGSGFGNGGVTGTVPWPVNLGGTSVTMNGVPAPLYAVTDGQINAQVPFEALAPGQTSGSVNIIVQRNGQNSALQNFQVVSFAPGIFSIAGNGLGLANAISPDGALAAPAGAVPPYASHPAASGGTVILLATGFGATDSFIASGASSIDKLRRTNILPTVLVGGLPAQVVFSGLSPQFPAVDQLNILLPAGVASGNAVPVQVSLGGVTTTSQLNIAIAPSTATATLTPLSTLPISGSLGKSLAFYGTYGYLCGSQNISVLDVTNPASPKLLSTIGGNAFNNVSNLYCYIDSGNLIAFADTGSTLAAGTGPSVTAFSLANPAQPQLIQQSALSKTFVSGVAHRGYSAFATFNSISFSGSTFLNQGGDLISVDLTNLTSPKVLSALSGNTSSGGGPNSFFDLIAVNDTTAYAGSSTSTGSQTSSGSGVLLVVDTSNPASPTVVKQVQIPGTRQVLSVRVQGNLAVTVNAVEGWRNPIDFTQGAIVGPDSVSTLDITDPRNPVVVTTTSTSMRPDLSGGGGAAIGNGQFAFAGQRTGTQSGFLLVDARNPQSPQVTTLNTPDVLHNIFVAAPNYLYSLIDNTGLRVYQIAQ
jgi:uncharacterized protein (TIGR03437 family)